MILFLDFDGVLHPQVRKGNDQPFDCIHHLWRILRACPHIEVVFSTSWREVYPFEILVDMVTTNGGEDLVGRFIGQTPVIEPEGEDDACLREVECLAWLRENEARWPPERRPVSWLALDDIEYWFSSDSGNLYLVDQRTGLTGTDVQQVIQQVQRFIDTTISARRPA